MSNEGAALETNPYQPPQAEVADVPEAAGALFYVVSPFKFWLLGVGTLGAYLLYWFYQHWALLNRRDKSYWPVARTIFSIFFAHALFNEIDAQLKRKRIAHFWAPGIWATVFVIATILNRIVSRLSLNMIPPVSAQLFMFALLAPILWSTFQAQRAANAAEGDPDGRTNENLTAANVIWLVLGAVWWTLILLGLYNLIYRPFD